MKEEDKTFILKNNLGLLDTFYYEEDRIEIFEYFQKKFEILINSNSKIYNMNPIIFFINDRLSCNAFAQRIDNRNVISINQGYPIIMNSKFTNKLFDDIIFAAFLNEKDVSDAFTDLYESNDFQFSEYMLDCSIQFTFYHEFRHIRQFDEMHGKSDLFLSESFSVQEFDFRKHIWEYDADKSAAHQVVLYVLSIHRKLGYKSKAILKCLLFSALSSLIITKYLFYFGLISQISPPYKIDISNFYTKKNWHPHPTVSAMNIFDSFNLSIEDGLPNLGINTQDLLTNSLYIAKLYFKILLPEYDVEKLISENMFSHINEANQYNDLLHQYALTDSAIKKLIKNKI